MEPSATSTLVTGTVGERFQVDTEDASVLDRPEPLRRLHDSGAGYKYPDLLTYLLLTRMVWLPEGEKLLNIHVLVSAEYTNVTDGRTDGQTLRDVLGHRAAKTDTTFVASNRLVAA